MPVSKILRVVLALGISAGLTIGLSHSLHDAPASPTHTPEPANDQNASLQTVAENALAGREGAIVVLDPQTGRIRAVVNPELAFNSAVPPGSAIKPGFASKVGLWDDFWGKRHFCPKNHFD